MDHRPDIAGHNPDRKHRRPAMGIELVVFATVFTLIVLLTGGPGPHA